MDISFLVGIVPGRGGFPFEGDFGIKICEFNLRMTMIKKFSDYKMCLK